MKLFTFTPPLVRRIVVSRGKSRFFPFILLIPLFFGGCLNPAGSGSSGGDSYPSVYTVAFKSNYAPDTTLYTRTVTAPATTVVDFPANPSRTGYTFAGWNTAVDGLGTGFTGSTTVDGDITVYAQWTEVSAGSSVVTFMSNDGTGAIHVVKTTAPPANTIGSGAFPGNPSRSGYTFGGWNTAPDGSGTPFTASTPVSGNITVYAQWTVTLPGSYAVTFMMDDGTDVPLAVKTAVAGIAISPGDFPAPPSRTGYNFGGWYTARNGGGTSFTDSTPVSGDITVYAQWTVVPPDSHTVTFALNDGTADVWATKTVTAPATTVTDFPANPVRDGYTFTAWNTQAGGSGTGFTNSITVSADITVYAQWTAVPPDSHTVTFRMNNGTADVWATKTVTAPATTVTDFPANPVRDGYTFTAWNTQAGGSGTGFTNSTPVSTDITVYAQWTAVPSGSYTVSFALNDGTAIILTTRTVTAPATTVTNFPHPNPTRNGYTFTGWNTQADGSGTGFTTTTPVSADITVYAQWTGNTYTVTFKSNYAPDTTLYTKTVTVPATTVTDFPDDPTRNEYGFAGWNTQADGSGTGFTNSTPVSGDITVYAQWTGNTYTVTFKSNYAPDTTLHTKTVTVPATTVTDFPGDPARSGYTFEGWNTQPNGSGTGFTDSTPVGGDITVYAQWSGPTYTVTFRRNYTLNVILFTKTVTPPATTVTDFPSNPIRDGYTFTGWNTQPDGSGTEFTASTTVSDDITVYTQWTRAVYTVTFMSNYAPDTVLDTKTVTAPAKNLTDFPADPTRNGYTFIKWTTQPDGSGIQFGDWITVSADITVYAQWSGNTYTVTFKSNYAPDTTLHTKTVTVPATTVTDFPGDPARSEYGFAGWNTQPDGSGTGFTNSTPVGGDITVYAQWAGNIYTVTFKSNYPPDTTLYTKTVTVPATTVTDFPASPAWDGYTFTRWNTQADGSGTGFTGSTTVGGDITVYAQWAWPSEITFNPDAGDGAFSDTDFTLSKSGSGNPASQTISITGSGYTDPRWMVDGTLKGTGASITLDAADYGVGGHNLSLIIRKNGVSWSRDIAFTITE
jgi:uncharacterized repeat protein (TIGR02543 family)